MARGEARAEYRVAPGAQLPTTFDPKGIEAAVRQFWDDAQVMAAVRKAVQGRPALGFVEGPPTMNGEPHIGHIRGRVLKDLWYRASTLDGFNVVFRAGWDTQGLPVEIQAERELGLTGSKVENLRAIGEERLVEECKRLVHRYNERWLYADRLLGMSLDYDRAYWTYRDEYIEREWRYLEAAWKRGLLGEGYRVVAYCPSCQTSLSHAEVGQGYAEVEDPSLYFKVRLEGEEAYLVLWTTMPFTIVTDELVGVKPDATYLYVRVGGELWVVGEERLEPLMVELGIDEYRVERRLKGRELAGRRYIHPLLDLIPGLQKITRQVHFVVDEEWVDTTTGTGLVHLSPANGEEDFQVAMARNLPVFNPIDDQARFTAEAGAFKGLFVRDADQRVIELLQERGMVVKASTIRHEYPLCWRSDHKLVWMARREYFYWVDRLGDLAVKAAEGVEYYYPGPRNRFIEIIKERVPWCISRERVWGAPLPIWVCSRCGEKVPAFSRQAIIASAVELPDGPDFELHKPWIDRVVLKCPKCGGRAYREPFVLDTWHNSGAAPYASFTDEEFGRLVPVAFLTEGIDQTRGWAYTLLIEHVILTGRPEAPYRAFLFQGHVLDEKGQKMSKSLGNVIDGIETLERHPVDLVRFYLVWKASPEDSLSFSFREMYGRPYQVLSTLYHIHIYFQQNSSYDGYKSGIHTLRWAKARGLLRAQERWLLSRLQGLVSRVRAGFERCRFHEAARALEYFIIEDLSQRYIPMTRGEIWEDDPKTSERRMAIYATLAHVLSTVDRLLHPIAPYLTEYLYQACFREKPTSILLDTLPKPDEEWVDENLEAAIATLDLVVSLTNSARMKAQLKRRWPLDHLYILGPGEHVSQLRALLPLLKELANVREVRLASSPREVPLRIDVRPNLARLGPRLKGQLAELDSILSGLDGWAAQEQLGAGGRLTVRLGGAEVTLEPGDLEFTVAPSEGYVLSEREGFKVLLYTVRDEGLVAEGLVRDLARRLQALRKERGFNPTDLLAAAHLAGLDEETIARLEPRKGELAFLVRVKEVHLYKGEPPARRWKEVELNGRKVLIDVG